MTTLHLPTAWLPSFMKKRPAAAVFCASMRLVMLLVAMQVYVPASSRTAAISIVDVTVAVVMFSELVILIPGTGTGGAVPFLLKVQATLGRGVPSKVQENETLVETNMATLEGSTTIFAGAGSGTY